MTPVHLDPPPENVLRVYAREDVDHVEIVWITRDGVILKLTGVGMNGDSWDKLLEPITLPPVPQDRP